MHSEYPNHGWVWLALYDDSGSAIYVNSDNCNDRELEAFTTIWLTTKGPQPGTSQPEFEGAWPNGINPYRVVQCTGTVYETIDIVLDYMTDQEWDASGHAGSKAGGEVHSTDAPAEWCDFYQHKKINNKCGLHPSRVHIKKSKFDGYSTNAKRHNFLLHETGHSFGFKDDCSVDALSNWGYTNCALPEGWIALDREEMKDHIYPRWKYCVNPQSPPCSP